MTATNHKRSAMYDDPTANAKKAEATRRNTSPAASLSIKQLDEKNAMNARHHKEGVDLRNKQNIERGQAALRPTRVAGFDDRLMKEQANLIAKHKKERAAMVQQHEATMDKARRPS